VPPGNARGKTNVLSDRAVKKVIQAALVYTRRAVLEPLDLKRSRRCSEVITTDDRQFVADQAQMSPPGVRAVSP
jgi:hypothetical protein